MQASLRFSVSPGFSRFSASRNRSAEQKRAEEFHAIVPFLLKLEQFIKLDDVEFGQDPPDFVFCHAGKRIGVELTDLVPKQFEAGGFARKADFKSWELEAKANPKPRHEFEWGEFTLRESLAAFTNQFEGKCQKAKKWNEVFAEKWLLMRVAKGAPFGGLVATKREDVAGQSAEVTEYFAKKAFELWSICQKPHPFQHIIMFSGMVVLALYAGENPHRFPVLSADVLARGKAASDIYLDWRSLPTSITEHPYLEPVIKPGDTTA